MNNNNFSLSLPFLDERKLSELSSPENIKNISLFNGNIFVCAAKEWTINEGISEYGYTIRNLDIKCDSITNTQINRMQIEFIDNKVEEYDIGEIIIIDVDNKYKNDSFAFEGVWITETIKAQNNKTIAFFSGIAVLFNVNSEDETIVINDILLNNNCLGIDNQILIVESENMNLNLLDIIENCDEKWAKVFSSINLLDSKTDDYNPIVYHRKNIGNDIITLFIPLTTNNEYNLNESISILNIEINLNIGNNERHYFSLTPHLISPIINNSVNPVTYLKEFGQ